LRFSGRLFCLHLAAGELFRLGRCEAMLRETPASSTLPIPHFTESTASHYSQLSAPPV
jgi:hypothetical protein